MSLLQISYCTSTRIHCLIYVTRFNGTMRCQTENMCQNAQTFLHVRFQRLLVVLQKKIELHFVQISSDMPELHAWTPLVRASRFAPLLLVRLELRRPAHLLASPRALAALLGGLAVAPLLLPLHSHTRVLIGAILRVLFFGLFAAFLNQSHTTIQYSIAASTMIS